MSLIRLSGRRPQDGALTPIGAMSRWISLLTAPTSVNADGSPSAGSAFATSWAFISPLTGAELDKAQQIAQQVSHLVVIPYLPGVLESMLVQFGTRTFQIQFIEDPNEMQYELRLYCAERGQSPA